MKQVKGWKAIPKLISYADTITQSYTVIDCPEYERDRPKVKAKPTYTTKTRWRKMYESKYRKSRRK